MKARNSGRPGDGRQCEAKQYSDEMVCYRCGFRYDVNDPDPPECLTPEEIGAEALRHARKRLSGSADPFYLAVLLETGALIISGIFLISAIRELLP